MGKSAVARDAIHYVLERRYFGGGVIHIECNNIKSYQVLENKFKNIIIKSLNLAPEDAIYQIIKKSHNEQFFEIITEFFDQKTEKLRLKNKKVNRKSELKFILCLDNA